MKLSDAPHAVGTPEHSAWVRNVFIPTVDAERAETDGELYGAPSIGARMILGAGHYDPDLWHPDDDVLGALERKIKDYERRTFEGLFLTPDQLRQANGLPDKVTFTDVDGAVHEVTLVFVPVDQASA